MSIESTKRLVQSGFGIWLASPASVAMAVAACVIWVDRPTALLAYEWFGRHRAVQHRTPGLFGLLVVLAFAILLVRWFLARRFGTIDVVSNLCIITIAIAEAVKGWLKFVFGRTWAAYGQPSFVFEGAYGFHPFHGGPDFASFPSGHSAAVCAVAVILWIYFPIIRTFCAATVAAILLALIAGDFHFLSDVVAGAFVGMSLSVLVVRVWEDRIRLGLAFSSPMSVFLRASTAFVGLVWRQGIDICMHRSEAAMAAKMKSGRMLFPRFDHGSMLQVRACLMICDTGMLATCEINSSRQSLNKGRQRAVQSKTVDEAINRGRALASSQNATIHVGVHT